MNTSGIGALVISVYKKYGVVLFEGAVQLTLFSETRINPSNSTAVRHNSRVRHKSSKYGRLSLHNAFSLHSHLSIATNVVTYLVTV